MWRLDEVDLGWAPCATCSAVLRSSSRPVLGEAIGETLPLAIAIAIFPVPIIASVLIVGSDCGRTKALAFVVAWAGGLAVVGAVVLLVAGVSDASDEGEPGTWVSVVLLLLGLFLFAAAVKQWRGRPNADEETTTPAWMRALANFTALKAAGAGFALSALNPKNLLLTVAAAAEIAELGLPASHELVALVVFVIIASAGVLTPLALSVALGERSRGLLEGLRAWMARYNAAIMAVLCVVIGAKLIGDAVTGLSH
jgi:threonine/homoserine/homoserine lactone efflux protein